MPVGILSRVDSPASAGKGESVARTLARPDEAAALARAATAHAAPAVDAQQVSNELDGPTGTHSAHGCDLRGPQDGSSEQPRIRPHDELRLSP